MIPLIPEFLKDPKHFFSDFRRILPVWWISKTEWFVLKAKLVAERKYAADRQRLAEREQERSKQQASEQKRREDARAACEFLFHRYAHVLTGRFSKETLEEFLKKYMGDERPAEAVEERGQQLQDTILQHVHQIEPPQKPHTIEGLAAWYKKPRK